MNFELLSIILVLSFSFYLWIGNKSSKNIKSSDDYYLSSRNIGVFPLLMTFVATQVGGGVLIGTADIAYNNGSQVLYYPLGVALGLVALGMGIGQKYKEMGISTTAEIFEKYFGSRLQRQIASFFSIASLFLILAAQIIALRKLFFVINVDITWIFPFFWGTIVLYTVMGGFKAVVYTDMVQAGFIIIVLLVSFYLSTGSVESSFNQAVDFESMEKSIPWIDWMLMPFCFILIEQDMAQRCFSSAKKSYVKIATFGSAFLVIICALISVYYGSLAKLYSLEISENTSVIVTSVSYFGGKTIATFFVSAIFMAILSTCDSLLCSISSNIFSDFIPEKLKSNKKSIFFAKVITGIVGISCYFTSLFFSDVITPLLLAYEMSVSLFFMPIMCVVFNIKINKNTVWTMIALSIIGYIIGNLSGYSGPIISIIVSLCVILLHYIINNFHKKYI